MFSALKAVDPKFQICHLCRIRSKRGWDFSLFTNLISHTTVLLSQAASEVENMKSQMMTLFKELQQAQSKLDEAEGMKKNLQDRSAL